MRVRMGKCSFFFVVGLVTGIIGIVNGIGWLSLLGGVVSGFNLAILLLGWSRYRVMEP